MAVYDAFNVIRSGLQVTEKLLHTKAMNIAGQGADAYKKQFLLVVDMPYVDDAGVATPTSGNTVNPTGSQAGLGVQSAGTFRDFSQGDPINTGYFSHLMIDGDGFFEVTLSDGKRGYTRVGAMQISGNGEFVMPKTGEIIVPGITLPTNVKTVSINSQGEVYATVTGSETPQLVGQFQITTFFNPSGLRAIGNSMFEATPAAGLADSGIPGTGRRGTIRQGWREGSNVNAVEEMTDLIQIEKSYDMLTKVLKTGDSMMKAATQMIV